MKLQIHINGFILDNRFYLKFLAYNLGCHRFWLCEICHI